MKVIKPKNPKIEKRINRHKRIRAKISGTLKRPRLAVFRSNKFVYAQIIDDEKAVTLVSISDEKMKGKTKSARARLAGLELAKASGAKKIKEVVFDRGGYIFTGRVRAFAEGAREGGLKF